MINPYCIHYFIHASLRVNMRENDACAEIYTEITMMINPEVKDTADNVKKQTKKRGLEESRPVSRWPLPINHEQRKPFILFTAMINDSAVDFSKVRKHYFLR